MSGSGSEIVNIRNEAEFKRHVEKELLSVVHFWAPWAKQCETMDEAVTIMKEEMPKVGFARVEAEELSDVSMALGISAVPTFLFYCKGKLLQRLEGVKAADLTKMVRNLEQQTREGLLTLQPVPLVPQQTLETRLKRLTNASKCMVFMKGDRNSPKCGFSKQIVEILEGLDAEYSTFDILNDEEVRQGLKTFSNWPTYPQLYIDGELIGGLDILKEMNESNELSPMVPKKQSMNFRLKSLINQADLMVFMKGSPDQPKCGFSRQLMEILHDIATLKFDTFDILLDDEVRQGLKKYSNWPTYPQIYAKGELVGGLDIIKELKESGELISTLKGGE